MRSLVRVVTTSESAAWDAATIAVGVPSRTLMQRAGAAAAAEIALRFRDRLQTFVCVLAGPGNNGGDAWVVARALAAAGVSVRVVEPVPAKTDDCRAERRLTVDVIGEDAVSPDARLTAGASLIVDGLLGTGSSGAPRGQILSAIQAANDARTNGSIVVALDLPSGLDASTGAVAGISVSASLTIAFGSLKRGLLVNREIAGAIVVVDIGLGTDTRDEPLQLADERWVASQIPAIGADAHKGTRKKLAIIGGAGGTSGAAMLAARAALRSGIGMVKLVVARDSLSPVQEAEPYALTAEWPVDDDGAQRDIAEWADAVVVGPGLGRSDTSRALLERTLRVWRGPTLLDADALTLWEGRAAELGALLAGRPALVTPHAVEFARLASRDVQEVLNERFDIGLSLSRTLGAVALLKGVPTVVTHPDGRRLVSATGTAVLATGGSGDVLSGIAGTLLAQTGDPFVAGAAGAWIHGRAAERVPTGTPAAARGLTLDDVLNELRDSWTLDTRPTRYPILAELPSLSAAP